MKTLRLCLLLAISLSLTAHADYVLRCKGVGSDKSKQGAVGLYSSASLTGTDYTLEAWVKPSDSSVPENVVFSQYYPKEAGRMLFGLFNGKLGFHANGNDGCSLDSDCSVPQGEWTHIAVVHSSTGLALYANGVLVGSAQQKLGSHPSDLLVVGGYLSTYLTQKTNTESYYQSNCRIAEARAWGVAKTAEEIAEQKDCRLTGSEKDLVAYWPFNEYDAESGTTPEYVCDQHCVPGPNQEMVEDVSLDFLPKVRRGAVVQYPVLAEGVRTSVSSLKTGLQFPPSSDFTIEAWLNVPHTNASEMTIVDQYASGKAGRAMFYLNYGRLAFFQNGQGGGTTVMAPTAIPTNEWVHVAVARSYGNKVCYFYTNGVLQSSVSLSKVGQFPDVAIGLFGITTTSYFQGMIRELRIWTKVRDQESIAGSMHKMLNGNESGLLGYFPLTEGTSKFKEIVTGGEYELPSAGFSWSETTRQWLARPDAWVRTPSFGGGYSTVASTGKKLVDARVFTFEAWVCQHHPKFGTAQEAHCLSQYASKTEGRTYLGFANQNKPTFYFGGATSVTLKAAAVPFDKWVHLAAVRDGDVFKLYVNGECVAKTTKAGCSDVCPDTELQIGNLHVTKGFVADGNNNSFDGAIREARVWTVARSDEEIKECYVRKLRGSEPGLLGYWPLSPELGLDSLVDLKRGSTAMPMRLLSLPLPVFPSLEEAKQPGMMLLVR